MVRWGLSLLMVALLLAATMSSPVAAQDDEPEIEYGAISGNAFELFNDDIGTGVEVVAFGPESGGENYGIVFKNFTDAPVYGISTSGEITGDDDTFRGIVSEDTIVPYAVPTNGLAINWLFPLEGDGAGDNASFDGDVDFLETPRTDGAPLVPVPIDVITRDDDVITARVFNGYLFDLLVGVGQLVCFDADGDVTNAAGATLREDEYEFQPIPSGGVANFDFELTGDTDCEFFLVGAQGVDLSTESIDAGTGTIANEPQVPSQADQGSGSTDASGSSGIVGPVADCTPFADYDQAQTYYAENPEEQPTIDPDFDGLACEVYFGVEPGGTSGTGSTPSNGGGSGDNGVVTVPEAPVAGPPPAQEPAVVDSPVYTGYGGLDGVDYDCYDFASPGEAQAYFEADGGSVYNNVDALDRNNNGLACEPGEFD